MNAKPDHLMTKAEAMCPRAIGKPFTVRKERSTVSGVIVSCKPHRVRVNGRHREVVFEIGLEYQGASKFVHTLHVTRIPQ